MTRGSGGAIGGIPREIVDARVATIWEVWTYDVWGNAREGYEVNDRRCQARAYMIECPVETYNAGTPQEFKGASPTDAQVKGALGLAPGTRLETDGDDVAIYVRRARDGYPLGELFCVSHESLSPIREYSLGQTWGIGS